MTDNPTVLVLGATGKTGRRLVPQLRDLGVAVRAASRHPGPGGTLFDWDRPETQGPALAGADAAYIVTPAMTWDPSPYVAPFLERAGTAGVRRVVLLSAWGVAQLGSTAAGFDRTERAVRDSGLEWTILQPTSFDQNFSEGFLVQGIREAGVAAAPTGAGSSPMVDAEDIAAVAAVALTQDGHAGAEYVVTGPASLTFAEAAAHVAAAAGRPVVHEDIPRQALLDVFAGFGMSDDLARMVVGTMDTIREGGAPDPSPDVEKVTGRPPTSFAAFATREAAAWR
jgi:uncharacterized protein YbjT (DUF2867 family)